MLKRWSIENFKSFREKTDIELAPINVFAGANSSGKSSIIQSILLLKQTLQYAPANRPIALNGPILKLGTFEDVKNAGSRKPYIGVSWTFDLEEPAPRSRLRSGVEVSPYQAVFFADVSDLKKAECKLRFEVRGIKRSRSAFRGRSSVDELLQLQPALSLVELKAQLRDASEDDSNREQRFRLTLRRSEHSAEQVEKQSKVTGGLSAAAESALGYDVRGIDRATQRDLLMPTPGGQIVGAEVRHFLPFRIGVRFDRAKRQARRIAAIICNVVQPQYRDRELLDVQIPAPVLQFLQNQPVLANVDPQTNLFEQSLDSPVSFQNLMDRIRHIQRTLSASTRRSLRRELVALRPQVENLLSTHLPSRMEVSLAQSEHIEDLVEYSRAYFVSAVRYLGPLRDEPKPVYPLEALANPTEVGYKGEHTAAVLDLHRDQLIEYIPSSFVESARLDRSLKTATVHDAVVDWLSYVGVAEDVKTDDQGKIGHRLQVQTRGLTRLHDLTNVGVGVSQVLPIIVMTLLAESPCLLIFEQPELHLHPKVQARLADFFLSAALLGKQCLLETHSEYLVERFRRRIAEAPDDSLVNMLKIYFTERKEGRTKCSPVNISRYGAITEYPEEFFDQSQLEAEGILEAARAKRILERTANQG